MRNRFICARASNGSLAKCRMSLSNRFLNGISHLAHWPIGIWSLFNGARRLSKPVFSVFEDPANDAAVVVDVTHDVVQRREAVQLAFFLHFTELVLVEFRLAHNAPIVSRGVHREAGSQGSIG